VTVFAIGVTNSTALGSTALGISTSSDPGVAFASFTIVAAAALGQLSVTASSLTGGASGVAYAVDLTLPAELPKAGSVTLAGPSGMQWPSLPGDYSLVDSTGSVSSGLQAVSISGPTATLTPGIVLSAGARVSLIISGVTNPASLSQVTAETDASPVAAAATVSASFPTTNDLDLSSPEAGATSVTYALSFDAGAGLASGSTITVTGPSGSDFADLGCSGIRLVDEATGDLNACGSTAVSDGGLALSVTTSAPISDGDRLDLILPGVQNPTATGPTSVALSGAVSVSMPETITAAQSVASLTLRQDTTEAGASEVQDSIAFLTHESLPGGEATISLTAPAGTTLPGASGCAYQLIDGATGVASCAGAVTAAGSQATVTVPSAIASGVGVTLVVSGLSNPPGTASGQVVLATSSDPTATSTPDDITTPASVGPALLRASSSEAGATDVVDALTITTHAALASGWGSVELTAPAGVALPAAGGGCPYEIVDDSTGQESCVPANDVSVSGERASVTVPSTIAANDGLTLVVSQLTNPSSAGDGSLSVATSSDPTALAVADDTSSTGSVGSFRLSDPADSARATGATDTMTFTANAALVAGQSDVLVTGPSGTDWSSSASSYSLIDDTTGQIDAGPAAMVSDGSATVQLANALAVSSGDRLTVVAKGVALPSSSASGTLSVSTSGDPAAASVSDDTVAPTSVTPEGVLVSSNGYGIGDVTYTIYFDVTGALTSGYSSVAATLPTGTKLAQPGCGTASLTDVTTNVTSTCPSGTVSVDGNQVSVNAAISAAHGDLVRLTLSDATNPASAAAPSISFSTSSDPLASISSYSLVKPQPLASVSVGVSPPAPSATDATYVVGLHTSSSGALAAGFGTITLDAPSGTVFPSSASDYAVFESEGNVDRTASAVSVTSGGSDVVVTVPTGIESNDGATLTISDVTNPATAANDSMSVSTSSDLAAKAAYALGATQTVSGSVMFDGSPVGLGSVQACNASSACTVAPTDFGGNFSFSLLSGTYTLTGFASSGGNVASPASIPVTVAGSAVTGLDITLAAEAPVTSGTTVTQDGRSFGPGSSLVIFASAPFSVTVDGCPSGGAGEAAAIVVNSDTGVPQTVSETLSETAPGSGVYTASFPSLIPLHGPIELGTWLPCYEESALEPNIGPPSGGNTVLLFGNGFDGATSVKFGSTPAPDFTVVSDSEITAVAPPGTGTVKVSVTTPGGTTESSSLAAYSYGEVSGVSPSFGAPGTTVTITGSGFEQGVRCVQFDTNTCASSFTVNSDTSISAVVPTGTGTVPIKVIGLGTTAVSSDESFTYGGADVVDAPVRSAHDRAGERQTARRGETVRPWGGIPGFFFPSGGPSAGGIDTMPAVVPAAGLLNAIAACIDHGFAAGDPGCSGGGVDPSGAVIDQFGDPVPGATVTVLRSDTAGGPFAATPNGSALTDPGTNPEQTGSDGQFAWDVLAGWYEVQASASGCYAPDDPQQSDAVTSPFDVPPPRTGIELTLWCPSKKAAPPSVASVSPSRFGSSGGGRVTVTGANLLGVTALTVGTRKATGLTILSPTAVTAVVPPGAGKQVLRVTTRSGESPVVDTAEITYAGVPTISSISAIRPSSSSADKSVLVTIIGTGLSGVTSATVGGKSLSFVPNSSSSGTVDVPARPGKIAITVTSNCPSDIVPTGSTACGLSKANSFQFVDLTHLQVGQKTTSVKHGHSVRITVTATDATTNKLLASFSVTLWKKVGNLAWKKLSVSRTNGRGVASAVVIPSTTTEYEWRSAATGGNGAAVSAIETVTIT
jgi:hypothetical protein